MRGKTYSTRTISTCNSLFCFSYDMYLCCLRTNNHKPTRAQISMMPIGTPRVPYRTPGEGTWQWVDLWNALVSCYLYAIIHERPVGLLSQRWHPLSHRWIVLLFSSSYFGPQTKLLNLSVFSITPPFLGNDLVGCFVNSDIHCFPWTYFSMYLKRWIETSTPLLPL